MLREGIARAKASLQQRDDAEEGRKIGRGRGQLKRGDTEAKRLLGLDLGEGSGFATLAEKCLELGEGVRPPSLSTESKELEMWWKIFLLKICFFSFVAPLLWHLVKTPTTHP